MTEISDDKQSFWERDFTLGQVGEFCLMFLSWGLAAFCFNELNYFSFLEESSFAKLASVATVLALIANVWVIFQTKLELKLDREERQEARDFQAWSNITNDNVPGPNKIIDLEYLHKKGRSFQELTLKWGTNLTRTPEQAKKLGSETFIDLRGADLRGINWKNVDLKGARLEGADLEGACLEAGDLRGAYLERVNLNNSHLKKAKLWGAHLEGSGLRGADLEEVVLMHTRLDGANLYQAKMMNVKIDNTHLEGANLSSTFFGKSDLNGVHLDGANLTHADMKRVLYVDQKEIDKAFCIRGESPSLPQGINPPPALDTYDEWIEKRDEILVQIKAEKDK